MFVRGISPSSPASDLLSGEEGSALAPRAPRRSISIPIGETDQTRILRPRRKEGGLALPLSAESVRTTSQRRVQFMHAAPKEHAKSDKSAGKKRLSFEVAKSDSSRAQKRTKVLPDENTHAQPHHMVSDSGEIGFTFKATRAHLVSSASSISSSSSSSSADIDSHNNPRPPMSIKAQRKEQAQKARLRRLPGNGKAGPWTDAELSNLLHGFQKYGSKWGAILREYTFHPKRTRTHLKDKWNYINAASRRKLIRRAGAITVTVCLHSSHRMERIAIENPSECTVLQFRNQVAEKMDLDLATLRLDVDAHRDIPDGDIVANYLSLSAPCILARIAEEETDAEADAPCNEEVEDCSASNACTPRGYLPQEYRCLEPDVSDSSSSPVSAVDDDDEASSDEEDAYVSSSPVHLSLGRDGKIVILGPLIRPCQAFWEDLESSLESGDLLIEHAPSLLGRDEGCVEVFEKSIREESVEFRVLPCKDTAFVPDMVKNLAFRYCVKVEDHGCVANPSTPQLDAEQSKTAGATAGSSQRRRRRRTGPKSWKLAVGAEIL